MLRLTIFMACVAYTLAATTTHKPHNTGTHHPHTTHEPSEHENFRFIYEPNTHKMLITSGHQCYVFTLSDDERVAVHTDAGIRAIELKLLSSITTATLTTMTKDQLDHKIVHACGTHITTYHVQTS